MRIFFGGTFDPPHNAHHEIFKALLEDSMCHHIHFVPTNLNPFKSKSFLSSQARWECLRTFLEDFKAQGSKWTLEDIELKKSPDSPSYTIDALRSLKAKYNDDLPWALCVGSDTLFDFEKWKDVDLLKKELHSLWIVPRGVDWPKIQGISQRILAGRFSSWSSTQIRVAIQNQDIPMLSESLSAGVLKVLKDEKII